MEIFFLGEDFAPVAQPVDAVESLVWTRRYFACGSFSMKLAPGAPCDVRAVKYVLNSSSGEVAGVDRVLWSEGAFTLSGRMLESLLDRRVVVGTAYMTGPIETLVRIVVRQNLLDARILPRFKMGEEQKFPDRGGLAYGWENLSDWTYSALRPYGMSYRITLDGETGDLVFSVVRGLDRTTEQEERAPAVFSDRAGNIASAEYERDETEHRNMAYVRSGDGYVENYRGSEVSGLERRELYVSARDVYFSGEGTASDHAEHLRARGSAALAKYPVTEIVRGVAADDGDLRYRRDYDLGDLCEVRLESAGISAKVRITSVDEVYENGSMRAYPAFGNEELSLSSYIKREIGKGI